MLPGTDAGERDLRKLLVALLVLGAAATGLWLWLWGRGAVAETTAAALKAYPVYAVARTQSETRFRGDRDGSVGAGALRHGTRLSGPRDRWVTTPNNDTLYSTAFLDLSQGAAELDIPALPGRYHSVAVMDARTDNWLVLGTRDSVPGPRTIRLVFGDGPEGERPAEGDGIVTTYRSPTLAETYRSPTLAETFRSPTRQVWLLIRTLVEGPEDLEAARAAQRGFVLRAVPPEEGEPAILPVVPDPATLLKVANPIIATNPHLQDPALAATGHGGPADAFETLPAWRKWLWRLLLPRLFEQMRAEIARGPRESPDGWSRTPPGIGTADASDGLRAAVALGGLGALPADEAVYWSAVLDADGKELEGGVRYRLKVPGDMPGQAFWSLSLYERLPDGRLFFVDNPIRRFTVGNRTSGLLRDADGGISLILAPTDPGSGANWLPTPPRGPITVIFRAYLPDPALQQGRWRLPPIERADP
jgi:hypothetical protein